MTSQFTPASQLFDHQSATNTAVEWLLREFHGATLVRVQAVHNNGLTLGSMVVQPLLNGINTDNTGTQRSTLTCMYSRQQGGVAAFVCDPVPGDIGIMVTTSRDYSNQSRTANAQPSTPPTRRRHNLADGVWLMTLTQQPPTTYIKVIAGAVDIITPGAVKVQAGGNVQVQAGGTLTATITGDATITAPNITLNGNVTVNGTLTQAGGGLSKFSGDMQGSGTITTTGNGVFAGTSVHTHTHLVTAVGSQTDTPTG